MLFDHHGRKTCKLNTEMVSRFMKATMPTINKPVASMQLNLLCTKNDQTAEYVVASYC